MTCVIFSESNFSLSFDDYGYEFEMIFMGLEHKRIFDGHSLSCYPAGACAKSGSPLHTLCIGPLKPKRWATPGGMECETFNIFVTKGGERFRAVFNEVPNHWFCERPPLWISLTFSSCLSPYLVNSPLNASWHLKLSHNCIVNYADTLSSVASILLLLKLNICVPRTQY